MGVEIDGRHAKSRVMTSRKNITVANVGVRLLSFLVRLYVKYRMWHSLRRLKKILEE